ncbi:MAG: hypothetical protein QOC82_3068 [Frankiaceae bacterium]|nr:hypothetical protein [Frankiaceae bacterium]
MAEPAYEKVSVTLPKDLVDSARQRAGDRGFSAYVAEGLRMAEHMADLDEFLAAHHKAHGPIPAELMEEVRRAWPDPRAAGGRRRSGR